MKMPRRCPLAGFLPWGGSDVVGACPQHCSHVAWAPLWLTEASVHRSLAFLQGKCTPQSFLKCGYKNCLYLLLCQERCHMSEHPLGLWHPCSTPGPTSRGHSGELSRRWRLGQLCPYCHKDISVNPGVLYRSGKKQDDH